MRRVLERVRDDVQKELPQTRAVREHDDVRDLRHRHGEPRRLAKDSRGLEHLVRQRRERHALAMQVEASLVGAREREQAVDEIRHSRGLVERLLERDELFRRRRALAHRTLHVGAHDGERRLELVARIRGEATQRGERALEALQHLVQRHRESRNLFASRHRKSAVQAASVSDRLHFVHQAIHRLKRAPRDRVRERDRREQQRSGRSPPLPR